MDEVGVNIIIRPFDADTDQACIYSTWRNSAYYGSGFHGESANRFFKKKTAEIREILQVAYVRVACLEDDPMTIIGYSVTTKRHLNFVYVKVEYRNKGIGTLLMPKNIETVTDQLTKIGEVLVLKKNLKTQGEKDGSSRSKRDKGAEENG